MMAISTKSSRVILLSAFAVAILVLSATWNRHQFSHDSPLRAYIDASLSSRTKPSAQKLSSKFILPNAISETPFLVGSLYQLDFRPYQKSYWTAKAVSEGGKYMFSVYPPHNDSSVGVLFCPHPATYELTVRVPVPLVTDGSTDIDPSHCGFYRESGPQIEGMKVGWMRLIDEKSVALQAMMRHCNLDKNDTVFPEGNNKLWYGGKPEPVAYGDETSIVFKTSLTCIASGESSQHPSHALDTVADLVYGPARSQLPNHALNSLGLWTHVETPGTESLDPYYAPQAAHCPLTFTDHPFVNFQGNCPERNGGPYYQWTPFMTSRADWVIKPELIKQCRAKGKALRLVGDSMMLQIWRGLDCVIRGYAGLQDQDFEPGVPAAFFYDMIPIFAPREIDIELEDKEIELLMALNHLPDEPGIELIFHGMWFAGNVPATEFARGMHRWFSALRRRSDKFGVEIYLVLLTMPQSAPEEFPFYVGWQTADRIAQWNSMVLTVAKLYDLKVIDLFAPTALRYDARIDNAHTCDAVNYENAMIVLNSICSP